MYWSKNIPLDQDSTMILPASKIRKRLQIYLALMALDCLCIISAFIFAGALTSPRYLQFEGITLAAIALPVYLGLVIHGQGYGLQVINKPGEAVLNAVTAMGITMFTVVTTLYFAKASLEISRLSFMVGIVLSAVLVAGIRWPFSVLAMRMMKGTLTNELVILDDARLPVPTGAYVLDLAAMNMTADLNDPYMLDRLGRWLRCFDRAIVACPADRREIWSRLLQGANIEGEIFIPEFNLSDAIGIGKFAGHTTQIVSKGPLRLANRVKKRLFDLAITVPALIVLSPVLAIIAIAIKLESKGPVLFMQSRVGRSNTLFNIYKFRSMRVESCDENGSRSASRDDDRITRVGRFIRGTSLDELPQLFNVLLGDMSLVGPRPHALGSLAGDKSFWEITPLYWCRHSLKPGITGLAQIRGFRGATDTEADLENRLHADLEYIRRWSLSQEILILLGTFRVLVHKNAF